MSLYRKPAPYRKPQTYRGSELSPAVPPPGYATGTRVPWQRAETGGARTCAPWRRKAQQAEAVRVQWQPATPLAGESRAGWQQAVALGESSRLPWQDYRQRVGVFTRAPWRQMQAQGDAARLPWDTPEPRNGVPHAMPWRQMQAQGGDLRAPWGWMLTREIARSALWRALAERGAVVALPWGPSGSYQRTIRTPYPTDPPDGGDPLTVPIRPVYIMIPTLTAVTLPDRTPVGLLSCSISTDASQYGWQLSASLPLAELAKVKPAPGVIPVIEITVNGYAWIFQVESYSDQRRFGSRTASITGTSRSAMLAAPHAPKRSRVEPVERIVSQLAEQELPGAAWTLAWEAVEWLVPGGTWSYADAAPIEAIAQLAASIGARVETDRTMLALSVKPHYPVSPWLWDESTPWAILPAHIVAAADGRLQGGANSNAVYVYGEGGYGALVEIAGLGGTEPAGMVVDRLITGADAARERGRHELAAAGRITSESVTLPLFPAPASPGLLPLGALVEIAEGPGLAWRGMVRAVRIDASRDGSAFSVRQGVTIERQHR